jgi:small nuclear ribonucleoprotein (snRNP)-like protein
MNFVTEKEYNDSIGKVKEYVDRQSKINRFKSELGKHLDEFNKFTFRIKDNRIIFAGYKIDDYKNEDKVVIGVSICNKDDVFDKLFGKLIAVRKALNLKIDDIVEIVEPIKEKEYAKDIIAAKCGSCGQQILIKTDYNFIR